MNGKNLKYKAVIFDFFGVISSEISELWFAKYCSPSQAKKLRAEHIFQADNGKISCEQMMERLGKQIGASGETVRKEWESILVINKKVLALIKKIKKNHQIVLLSDAPAEYLRGILRQYKLTKLFDWIIISSELKTTKKEKKIFQAALKKLGIKAAEAVFIDDNPANVRLAKKIGMKGIVYKSDEQTLSKLKELLIVTV